MSGRLRRIAIDVTPLRVSHDFRLLWTGSLISALGSQFVRVGLYIQVYALTASPAQVGLLGVSALVGNVAGTFIGGSFIDAHDRRLVLIWTQIGHVAVSGWLVAGAIGGHPPLLLLHVANLLTWGLGAIDGAARQAATPRLVGAEIMPSAVALNQVLWQTTGIVGPALAGVLIARTSPTSAYAVDLVSYLGLLVAAIAIQPLPPLPSPDGARPVGTRAVREGLRYVGHHRLIRSTFVIDLIAMIFGMPAALFPVLAVGQFHRGPEVVGLLFAAPAVGALAQLLVAGSVTRIRRQGQAVIWSVAGWGAAIAAFGSVGAHLAWALLFLAIAGGNRFAISACPREENRAERADARTSAGTPSSIAAIAVQRPSPESATRPANPSSAGESCNAAAARSSSHDATTLPRRQSSATAAMSMSYR